jgi:SAM-dependent methyltransferase
MSAIGKALKSPSVRSAYREARSFVKFARWLATGKQNPFDFSRLSASREPVPVFVSADGPISAPGKGVVSSRRVTPRMVFMAAHGRGSVPDSDSVVRKVRGIFRGESVKALSLQKVSIASGMGVGAVKAALDRLVREGMLKTEDGNVYFHEWLNGPAKHQALSEAQTAEEERFNKFLDAVNAFGVDLGREKRPRPREGDIVSALTQCASSFCSREDIELLIINQDGSLDLARGAFESRFQPAEAPSGYIRTILEGNEDFYDLTIIGDKVEARNREDAASTALAGELSKEKMRVRSYAAAGFERIIFLKLKSNEHAPEGVLVFYNPVFFEAKPYDKIKFEFNTIAKVTGEALSRKIQPRVGPGLAKTSLETSLIPASQKRGVMKYDFEKERGIWDKGARHYDWRIEGEVDHTSRTDVMAYLAARIQETLEKAGPKEKVKILDLACGTGNMLPYILRAFKDQVHRLSIAMVDWSGMAVDRARARADRLTRELGLKSLDIQFEVEDMVRVAELFPEDTFDIAFSHMGFYAPEARVAQSVFGLVRVMKPGAYGSLDIMKDGGTLAVVKKQTLVHELRSKGLLRTLWLIVKKIVSGAFGYARFLEGGFRKGRYFAPDKARWVSFLKEQGLETSEAVTRETLADQFLLSSIRKPE